MIVSASAVGLLAGAVTLGAGLGCNVAPPGVAPIVESASAQAPAEIRHLEPRPDSVGPQPARFAWTAVDGAESYTLRIWTEADVRIALESGITETFVAFPEEIRLAAGTYFWSVMAVRGDRPIAESGLAAFVVSQ